MSIENEVEGRNLPHARYKVQFEIDVAATTPERAAAIVRDWLLDPSYRVMCDIYPIEWYEPADDFVPTEDPQWCAGFRNGGVHPSECFGIMRVK